MMVRGKNYKSFGRLFWEWWQRSFLRKVLTTKKLPFYKIIKVAWINTKIYQLAHRTPFLFEHILIQTNNRCTQKCKFCLYGMKGVVVEDQVMQDWLFEKIVKELSEIDYSGRVSLFEMNEPLTEPRIVNMVRYVKKHVPKSYQMLVTNGDLLTRKKVIDLVRSGIDYLFVNAYSHLVHKENESIVERLPKDVKRHIIYEGVVDSKHPDDNRGGNLPHISQPKEPLEEPCSRVGHILYIKPDGTAVSCFSDFFNKNIVGDAKNQTVSEIWFGEKFAQLRNDLNKGNRQISEICRRCNMSSNYTFVTERRMRECLPGPDRIEGAIVGASSSAEMFYPALKKHSNVKYLVSKGGFDNKLFYEHNLNIADYQKVLSDPEIDYIFVANQNKFHYEVAKQALLAEKHVLVEKPITLDIDELNELIEISKERGLLIGGIFQFRFLDVVRLVKELVANGKFGELIFINARLLWNRPKSYFVRGRGSWDIDGGGVLIKQAIHCLDLLMHIAGDPVGYYSYNSNRLNHSETEDAAIISIKFNDGLGTLIATTSCSESSPATIEVIGTEGRIVFDLGGNITHWKNISLQRPKINRKLDPCEMQIKNFMNSINRQEDLVVTAEECRKSLSVILNGCKQLGGGTNGRTVS